MNRQKGDTHSIVPDTIAKAQSILLITHEHLDHDAVCSLLILKKILTEYYEKESVEMIVQEEKWPQFESLMLDGIEHIINIDRENKVPTEKYDLVFVLDAHTLSRCINSTESFTKLGERTIIIDHHDTEPDHPFIAHINDNLSATAEQLYLLFKPELPKLQNDATIAELAQIAIIADTNRFLYNDLLTSSTFTTMGELFRIAPVNMETIYYDLVKNTRRSIYIFNHIIENLKFDGDLAYSYISRDFVEDNTSTPTDIESAKSMFLQFYVRTLEDTNWGFLVQPASEEGFWKVSLRAKADSVNVFKIAHTLGGGGHTSAAGAKFEVDTAQNAVRKILETIHEITQ